MPATLQKKKVSVKKKKVLTKVKKKPVRAVKKKVMKAKRTVKKKPVVKRRSVAPTRKQMTAVPQSLPLSLPVIPLAHGKVVHYYDRIGVAIIEVSMPFSLGDFVRIRHGDDEFIQPVTSLQVEHQPVARANTGDFVGLRVMKKIPEGTMILPM